MWHHTQVLRMEQCVDTAHHMLSQQAPVPAASDAEGRAAERPAAQDGVQWQSRKLAKEAPDLLVLFLPFQAKHSPLLMAGERTKWHRSHEAHSF